MNVDIRQFSFEGDMQAVLELWSHAGPGIQISASDQPQEIRKKIARDPDLFLLAEQDGEIIAAVLGGFDGRRGMLYHLAVAPAFRRQGVASRLVAELENRLRAKGCLKYYLLVTKDNTDALDFYHDIGCEIMPLHALGKVIA